MDPSPGDEMYQFAGWLGRKFANRQGEYWAVDDWAQEAKLALVIEWPRMLKHYKGTVPRGAVRIAVQRRLIDALRRERGRTYTKPHIWARPLEYNNGEPVDPVDRNADTEGEAIARLKEEPDLREVIEKLIAPAPARHRPRFRKICQMIAAGKRQAAIGAELGVSASRVCQLLSELHSYHA